MEPKVSYYAQATIEEYETEEEQGKFDADDDNEIMEDVMPPEAVLHSSRATEDTIKHTKQGKVETPKCTLPEPNSITGKIFGISKEMSSHLQEVLKPKSPAKNIVASVFGPRLKGALIYLQMEDLEVQHEILVMLDGYNPAWLYKPAVWYANRKVPPSTTDAPSIIAKNTISVEPQADTQDESGEEMHPDSPDRDFIICKPNGADERKMFETRM
ncbi:hypothetical protein EVJ58_g7711 [Rhodofomes roseus]|uniref:Uncharacterized protein n=1 Tax=Rhodofomes roseus TaxID=34475 RepID=A0A4Y9Y1T2_9APHY|nr:hypothetical protein EVJ58_g7711 [Rhodofomes roseus]